MGKRNKFIKPFIKIDHEILQSEAYINLSFTARALLVELVLQFNGKNNGDLSVTFSLLKSRGFGSSSTITAKKNELITAGLIQETKSPLKYGTAYEKMGLYAVTWHPIHDCRNKFGLRKLEALPTSHPSNLWKNKEVVDIKKAKEKFKSKREKQIIKDLMQYTKDYK